MDCMSPSGTSARSFKLLGGIGHGAQRAFSFTQSGCVGTAVCTSQTQAGGLRRDTLTSISASGVQVFVTEPHLREADIRLSLRSGPDRSVRRFERSDVHVQRWLRARGR